MISFFNEKKNSQDKVTPTFSEVIKQAIDSYSAETKVCMPAQVVRYDHAKQVIDAKPYQKRKYRDGKTETPPIIYNVPVAFQRAGEAFISLPIEVGHSVLLVFADRSLEKWLSTGQESDPEDVRKHHISDAIAFPGCYPFSSPASVNNAKDIIIKNKDIEIRAKKNGHLMILNSSNELIKILDEWMTASINGSHTWKIRIRNKLRTFLER